MDEQFTDYIEHQGVVTGTEPRRGIVYVLVDESGECGSCPAAKLCNIAGGNGMENGNKIEIATRNATRFKVGDRVTVRGTERMHRKAIMLATVFPSFALVAVMVAIFLMTGNQLLSALCGLGVTILFFVMLYLCRNKIAHEFSFDIINTIKD